MQGQDLAIQLVVEQWATKVHSKEPLPSWRARLDDLESEGPGLMVAIEGLAEVGGSEDQQRLIAWITQEDTAVPVRLACCKSLGKQVHTGLENLATQIATSNAPMRELLVAYLLTEHDSSAARQILLPLLQSSLAPATRLAYDNLARNDLALAYEHANDMLASGDHYVRLSAVNVLHQFDAVEDMRQQAVAIQDENPTMRRTVREHLIEKAQQDPGKFRGAVDEIVSYQLQGGSWQGIEQSILIAVRLEERERCPQLLALLEHTEPDVHIRAAWALQELANSPDIMQAIHEYCQGWTEKLDQGNLIEHKIILRLAYLLEALGRNKYQPAKEMLQLYVPKNSQKMNPITRTSAIWALGRIWEGSQNLELAKQLAQRMLDNDPIAPEADSVQYVSALALGYIGCKESIRPLNTAGPVPPLKLGHAAAWSLSQLGESSFLDSRRER